MSSLMRMLLMVAPLACTILVFVVFPWDFKETAMNVYSAHATTELDEEETGRANIFGMHETYILFFDVKMCLPGYEPPECTERLHPANYWYTEDCPNLEDPEGKTFDDNVATSQLGGHVGCDAFNGVDVVTPCAYLCYAHPSYGTAIVPHVVWEHAQTQEGPWAEAMAQQGFSDDRSADYFEGFSLYAEVPRNMGPIKLIEVGAGPWTQSKGLLYQRPDIQISEATLVEPSAQWYMENVATCSYKTGRLRRFSDNTYHDNNYHDFPVKLILNGGESLLQHGIQYDALVAINVIEHVQNAFAYLSGLHHVLKPGGLLIFHERIYYDPLSADKVLGNGGFHPIRLNSNSFNIFLNQFDPLFF